MEPTTGPLLSELILERKGSRSFANLARDCEGVLTAKRWQQLATSAFKEFPTPQVFLGMSLALSVPVDDLVLAAGREVGLPIRRGQDPSVLMVAGAGNLPPEAQELVLQFARDLQRAHDARRASVGK